MSQSFTTRICGALVLAAVAGLAGARAEAALVATSSGATLGFADEYLATTGSTAATPVYSTTTNPANEYLLAVPGQYNFNRSFGAPQSLVLGTSTVAGDYSFQDSYVFQVGAAAAGDTAVATLNLPPSFGMSDLQLRLYQITSGTTTPVVGTLTGNPAVVAVVSGWQGSPGLNTTQVIANFSGLQANSTYVLDIAGTASGTGGGQYYGALNLQAVPLPPALWLMLSGLGGLGILVRRPRPA